MFLRNSVGLGLMMGLLTVVVWADIKNGKSTTTTGDDVTSMRDRQFTGMPLVVSVPSKVFRANKVNSNDVFERPIDLHDVLLEEERRRNLRMMPAVQQQQQPQHLEVALPLFFTAASTDSTTATTTGTSPATAKTSKLRTTIATTEAPPSTSTEASNMQSRSSRKQVTTEETKMEPSRKTFPSSNDTSTTTTTTTTTTTEVPTTTTSEVTIEEVTAKQSSDTFNSDMTSNWTAPSTTPSPRSDEIIEHDYGKSLGFNTEDSAERSAKSETAAFEDDAEAIQEEEEAAADPDSALDPMDVEGAQESQLDYVVVDPSEFAVRDSRDVSVFHDGRQSPTTDDVVLHPLDAAAEPPLIAIKPVNRKKLEVSKRKRKFGRKEEAPMMVVLTSNGSNSDFGEPEVAASEQRSEYLLAPEVEPGIGGGVGGADGRDARDTDGSSILETDEDDADPPVLSDDGEYEYIYEYIDLNSTDVDPENLPEGAVIVTDEQLESGQPLFPPSKGESNVTVQIIDAVSSAIAAAVNNQSATDATIVGPVVEVDASLGQLSLLSTSSPPGSIPMPLELPVQFKPADSMPFVVGMPESPVYFVGIRSEKIDGDQQTSSSSNSKKDGGVEQPLSANDLSDRKLTTDRGTEAHLTSLYALSKALPYDEDSMSRMLNGNESGSLLLPIDLPDPFSEELLRGDVAKSNESMTTEPMTTMTEWSDTEMTTEVSLTTTTTTVAPTTTMATTEPPTTMVTTAPKTEAGRGGGRPRGTRRSTTTTTTTTTTESPTSEAPNKKARPTRLGGRRRSSTASPPPVEASPSSDEDVANDETTSATTTERPRFGGRGRGRFTTPRPSRPASTTTSSGDPEAEAGNDSNSIAGNGGKRASSGRRTTTSRPAAVNGTKDEQKATRKNNRPATGSSSPRGRRPTTTTTARAGVDKTATGKPTSDVEGESAEAATPRKSQLFRPRNRGRFGPKSKVPAVHEGEEGEEAVDPVDEQPETETSSATAAASTAASAAAPTSTGTANEVSVVTEAVQSTIADDLEADADVGSLRKFPPRFRPGSRATIPHRTTEPSAAGAAVDTDA